ncbi:hypothetical protein [Escherichia coli]|uniref:hypothetical protein n=1 Tax=Escherichia coli TaxID=562 RepID=UPI001FCEFC43|nr:hypothetical protein [Escherichia coli]
MNISVEDLFPESFQRIKEEEANRPDPNWFAHLPPEKINAYMSKYPFKSFDDIPLDNSGLQYPSLQELEFYFPPAALAANCHQLPERMRQKPVVTMINGLTLLRSLGVQAFNIDPRRWHKIAYSALFDHGFASKSDQRFAYFRSTGNLTFSTAF